MNVCFNCLQWPPKKGGQQTRKPDLSHPRNQVSSKLQYMHRQIHYYEFLVLILHSGVTSPQNDHMDRYSLVLVDCTE